MLAQLFKLTRLSLQCINGVTDHYISRLGTVSNLKCLFLNCTSVTGSGFQRLNWPNLRKLSLGSAVETDQLRYICGSAPALADLRLDRCNKVCLLHAMLAPLHLRVCGCPWLAVLLPTLLSQKEASRTLAGDISQGAACAGVDKFTPSKLRATDATWHGGPQAQPAAA